MEIIFNLEIIGYELLGNQTVYRKLSVEKSSLSEVL